MHRRGVDLLRYFSATTLNNIILLLVGIKPRNIDSMRIQIGRAMGHPVCDDLPNTGSIFHPDRFGKPQSGDFWRLTYQGPTIGGHRQQAIKAVPLLPAQLAQNRRHLDGFFVGMHHLV